MKLDGYKGIPLVRFYSGEFSQYIFIYPLSDSPFLAY